MKKGNLDILAEAARTVGLQSNMIIDTKSHKVLEISNKDKFFLAGTKGPGFYPEARRWNATFSHNKLLTQKVLHKLGYNVIESVAVHEADFKSFSELWDKITKKTVHYPVLIKPNKGLRGKGITIAENPTALRTSLNFLYQKNDDCMIQPILDENEYRILVINHKVKVMHSKHNPFVAGDGTSTITQLLKNIPTSKKSDPFIKWQHAKLQTKSSSVLPEGQRFEYNLTKTDTTYYYETTNVPAVVKNWATTLSKKISSQVVGIDVFIPGKLSDTKNYTIIELNTNPSVDYLIFNCGDEKTPYLIFEEMLRDYFKL